jgi:FAD:protein FMN transferase
MQYLVKIIPNDKKLLYAWFSAMYTRVDLVVSSNVPSDELIKIAEQIEIELKRVERFANRFDAESEISQLNSSAYEKSKVVSEELFQVIDECLKYHQKTLGYFDITVSSTSYLKDGIANILLNKENRTIKFLDPDVKIDLSGFIKGYALRAVRQFLQSKNITDALINVGNSSILAMGSHPNGSGWKISFPDLKTTGECVLHNECLTTSGNNGQTKWPIHQPKTGQAVGIAQPVSVITDDPGIGEVLSTALYVANENEKYLILNQLNGKIVDFAHIP